MDTSNSSNVISDADLAIGADEIARRVFGGKLNQRQVYRIAERGDWPFFRLQGKLACRPSAMFAEMERRERAAIGKAA